MSFLPMRSHPECFRVAARFGSEISPGHPTTPGHPHATAGQTPCLCEARGTRDHLGAARVPGDRVDTPNGS